MKHRRIITTLAALSLALGLTTTAHSETSDTTAATFEVTSTTGSLAITAPDGSVTPISLGSVAAGLTTLSSPLGTVTVTDTRALATATWTAKATSTDFALTNADLLDVNQYVPAASILYTPGTITMSVGTGTPVGTAGTLDPTTGSTVVYLDSGNSTATWNPTLTITLLDTQVAGVYTGTITHSVS